MRISELQEKLATIKKLQGDIHVVVQYRDEDGDYNGHDGFLEMRVEPQGISEWELVNPEFCDLGLYDNVLVL